MYQTGNRQNTALLWQIADLLCLIIFPLPRLLHTCPLEVAFEMCSSLPTSHWQGPQEGISARNLSYDFDLQRQRCKFLQSHE
jgi:hypothetical protein